VARRCPEAIAEVISKGGDDDKERAFCLADTRYQASDPTSASEKPSCLNSGSPAQFPGHLNAESKSETSKPGKLLDAQLSPEKGTKRKCFDIVPSKPVLHHYPQDSGSTKDFGVTNLQKLSSSASTSTDFYTHVKACSVEAMPMVSGTLGEPISYRFVASSLALGSLFGKGELQICNSPRYAVAVLWTALSHELGSFDAMSKPAEARHSLSEREDSLRISFRKKFAPSVDQANMSKTHCQFLQSISYKSPRAAIWEHLCNHHLRSKFDHAGTA